ncbi:hypothetical protein ACETK8_15890 [Brevundimonas staleyi]|uniref:Uncharacterized protein n=1 Tax=Brevundimonas staleyi TaxID=74326 RepID=A0ABW0FZD0_9CAUL
MTTPAIAEAASHLVHRHDDAEAVGVACLLLAIEASDTRRVVVRPLAHETGGMVAATVMIDVGDGPLPFPLGAVRLAAACLRADPPFAGAIELAASLDHAVDQAETAVTQLLRSLN